MTTSSDIAPGILLIGNYPPPFGGVPRHIEDLVPYLVQAGWQVHVLSGGTGSGLKGHGFSIHRDARSKLRRRMGTLGFLARSLAGGRGGALLRTAGLLPLRVWLAVMTRVSLGAAILERQGVRVISGYNLLDGGPVAMILGELYELPVAVTNLGEIYSHERAMRRQLPMVRRIVRRAAALLSPTEHCARSYASLGLAPEVKVIHHGVDLGRFTPGLSGAAIRRRFGYEATSPVIAYIGRLMHDMGLHTLLTAIPLVLARCPDARFLIAGAGGELLPEARAAASRWPGRVAVAVDVPLGELPEHYAAASVVVVPTRGARACGSLAAAEAMATGKAVVATDVGGIPEFVADGATGVLVPPESPERLAEALVGVLADPALSARMGQAGRQRVKQLFDTATVNREFERVFRGVLRQR
ncbi:MAG: glycosyltransferase family 4 protein [Gemmatimonadales bacterium]|nr:glycosyltransferase family 4 protein [Gemmatimonadales bacterium]